MDSGEYVGHDDDEPGRVKIPYAPSRNPGGEIREALQKLEETKGPHPRRDVLITIATALDSGAHPATLMAALKRENLEPEKLFSETSAPDANGNGKHPVTVNGFYPVASSISTKR